VLFFIGMGSGAFANVRVVFVITCGFSNWRTAVWWVCEDGQAPFWK